MNQASCILLAPVGELYAMWNSYLEKYVVMYLDDIKDMIMMRISDNPWGPWSNSIPVVSSSEYPGLYGGFMHPELMENNGQIV